MMQNEANTKEISAYRDFIKCTKEHRLEYHFSPNPIRTCVAQLEKEKADRKRYAGVVKSQPKNPLANGRNVGVYMPPLTAAKRTLTTLYVSSSPTDSLLWIITLGTSSGRMPAL